MEKKAKALRVTVRFGGEASTVFTRRTTRTAVREIKLLWVEFPNAKQIELEPAKVAA